jgi:erythromycin esterase-like protein
MVQIIDRDRHWSDNIQWIPDQEGPEAKIIIYAHNGYVAGDGPEGRRTKCAPMGELLRQVFGGRMLNYRHGIL